MKIKSMLVFLGLFLVAANANIIDNPTFANGLASWDLANYSGAYATFSGQSSGGLFTIATPGTERWHVQLSQRALKIVKGKTYQLFFRHLPSDCRELSTCALGEAAHHMTRMANLVA